MNTTFTRLVWGVGWICSAGLAFAQPKADQPTALPLNDLSAFQKPGNNWRIVGDVAANLSQNTVLTSTKGTGILANLPAKDGNIDLVSNFQHGDVDLDLDFLIAKGSNSGIYLQGRYEVQLLDSWGVKAPKAGDNGGIYERWDDSRPEGQKGYEGHPPRQNASRAPGLWQHLKISFQAPRFDASGKKIENARMLLVELNGVAIHENVELSGPTRGALGNNEVAMGPLRIQGDHGPVAIRNIVIKNYDKPRPELTNLKYTVYKGRFDKEPDFSKLPPEAEGSSVLLTANVTRIPNDFLIRYTGTLRVKEPGEYAFNLGAAGGGGMMKINNQVVIAPGDRRQRGTVSLPAGEVPFELLYAKMEDWAKPSIGLAVTGPGIREYIISDPGSAATGDPVDPILVNATANTVLRSFMDMPGYKNAQGRTLRVVHAVSVGSPEQVHYTYDMDNGTLVQVWRGQFLDATPMWHERGDGSSRPVGMVQRLGTPMLGLAKLASPQAAWVSDTTGTGFRTRGYVLDESDRPTFRYQVYGATVSDAIRVLENGQGVRREMTVQNPSADLYARLAEGATIAALENGMYLVDGKAYYVRVDDAGGATPAVRKVGDRQELIVPVKGKLSYSILF
ncbi:family 16 glycoside hydrolase [Larkinella sp. VNQ87]|uniref:family 16 glycoside hydrolase n=1 Tax=Larkinella sp. VNQ87 TaxID=3400921 RepID=UPI003C015B6D